MARYLGPCTSPIAKAIENLESQDEKSQSLTMSLNQMAIPMLIHRGKRLFLRVRDEDNALTGCINTSEPHGSTGSITANISRSHMPPMALSLSIANSNFFREFDPVGFMDSSLGSTWGNKYAKRSKLIDFHLLFFNPFRSTPSPQDLQFPIPTTI